MLVDVTISYVTISYFSKGSPKEPSVGLISTPEISASINLTDHANSNGTSKGPRELVVAPLEVTVKLTMDS